MIDLKSIEYALLVLDHGSFRKAAQEIGTRPSVVSRRVQALEDALGVSLFHRQSQGARPTHAGHRVLSTGRVIVEKTRGLTRVAVEMGSAARGTLCIGVVASITGGHARRLLRDFLDAHAGVSIDVVEGAPRDHIAAVRGLHMDATFVVGSPSASDCELEALWSERIMVALPSRHPLAAEDIVGMESLAAERFVVSRVEPGPDIHDYVIQRLARLGRHPEVGSYAVQREGLMALIGLDQGVSLVSTAETDVAYPGVTFRPLEDETLPFSVIWSASNDNPALRRFLSLARTSRHFRSRVSR